MQASPVKRGKTFAHPRTSRRGFERWRTFAPSFEDNIMIKPVAGAPTPEELEYQRCQDELYALFDHLLNQIGIRGKDRVFLLVDYLLSEIDIVHQNADDGDTMIDYVIDQLSEGRAKPKGEGAGTEDRK
jgi:hypothetical protein